MVSLLEVQGGVEEVFFEQKEEGGKTHRAERSHYKLN